MKVVIVGGVAGGATAAARLRRLDETAEIVLFERSGFISYANCGLPYYIGGVIEDEAELTLQTPESFARRFGVQVHVRHEVTAIDRAAKTVTVRDLATGRTFAEPYDKLLLAPGAKPTRPALPGIGLGRLFTLRTVEDTLRIHEFVTAQRPRSVVLAGGGFIGLELAENLRARGLEVTIVQRPAHLMSPFDADMAALLHREVRAHGVRLALGHTVEGFAETEGGVQVLLRDAPPLAADFVVLAIGVTPDSHLAADAGLDLGVKGSIGGQRPHADLRPRHLRRGRRRAGAAFRHRAAGGRRAGRARQQAGAHRGRQHLRRRQPLPRRAGQLGAQGVRPDRRRHGLSEAAARKAGLDADAVLLSPMDHAGYYPGGSVMTMKVVFERGSGRLLGAQVIGRSGADKRIDVLATALRAGWTAAELTELDLAYAPPYALGQRPREHWRGYMIENLLTGKVQQFRLEDLPALPRDGSVTLLDVRTPGEYRAGHVDGFANLPLDDLRAPPGRAGPRQAVYVMCQSGLRSYLACRILAQHGFACYNFAGGYRYYEAVTTDRRQREQAFTCGMDRPGT